MAVALEVIDGAEVRVETGVGKITEVKPKGDRNAQVFITAPHLREVVTGWVDRQSAQWGRVEYAAAHGIDVFYRVEVKRKRDVAKDRPLAELGNREKVRDLVLIDRPENAPAPASGGSDARPAPENPPAAATAPPATDSAPPPDPAGDAPMPGQADHALELLAEAVRKGEAPEVIDFCRQMAADLGASPEQLDAACHRRADRSAHPAAADPWAASPPTDGDLPAQALAHARDPDRVAERAPAARATEQPNGGAAAGPAVSPTSGLSRQNRAIASDARPWEQTNSDGRLNLSSYAAGAVADFVGLAGRLLITRARQRHAEDPTFVLAAPTQKQVYGLAATLLNVADVVQHQMREGGRVDRMASSHKLARQAVREALDLFPVPWGADDVTRESWRKALVDYAGTQVAVVVDLLSRPPGEEGGE